MSNNKLNLLVQHYVDKRLTEVFKRIDLEKIVEKVVAQKIASLKLSVPATPKRSMKEVFDTEKVVEETVRPPIKRKITAESLGITDDVWKDIYADTLRSGNPILSSVAEDEDAAPSATNPEHVPETVLENMGLMRDYSKHIGYAGDEKKQKDDAEWQELRIKRQKMLDESIKRSR